MSGFVIPGIFLICLVIPQGAPGSRLRFRGGQGVRKNSDRSEKGFSLVELVIAMGIATFVLAAIVLSHRHQTKTATNLAMAVAAQQNMRASLHHMERDMRMIGADLHGGAYNATTPILIAESDEIAFSWDDDKDGVIIPAEVIRYTLYDSSGLKTRNLGRSEGGAHNQPVAQNIEALDIHYFAENTTVPMTRPVTGEDRRRISRVQLTLVARTRTALKFRRIRSSARLLNPQGDEVLGPQKDGFMRILISSDVFLRNVGIAN